MSESLQQRFAADGACFGCGPANPKGLRIASRSGGGGELICDWTPEPWHEAFPGCLSGGIAGTLLDCHSNWTAAYHLMKRDSAREIPCTVTAEYAVKLLRPIPTTNGPLRLRARVVGEGTRSAEVEAALEAEGVVCATCRGKFVAVKEGHPAFHRWGNAAVR